MLEINVHFMLLKIWPSSTLAGVYSKALVLLPSEMSSPDFFLGRRSDLCDPQEVIVTNT